jgi:GAF domain-containing protein
MSTNIKTINEMREELRDRLTKLRDNLKCDSVTLHLYDSEREQLYLPVGIDLLEEGNFYRTVPSMERIVGKIIRGRNPIIANDAEHHPDMTGPFTHIEKNKSVAGIPVKNTKDEVLGVVFVSYRVSHRFEDDEVKQIENWANETAAFIEQTFKSVNGKTLRFTLRREAGLRKETVKCQDILKRLQGVLRNVDIALWLPKRGESKLAISANIGINSDLLESEIEISKTSKNPVLDVFINNKEQIIENYQENPDVIFNSDVRTPWERIQLFPIMSDYHSLGVLSVFRRDSFGFTFQELDAIKAFTSLLAVTIQNEERIIALNALHDVGVRLTLSLDLREVLDEIVRSTCQIIGADVATLHLYDPVEQQFYELDRAAIYPESARSYMEKPQSEGGLTSEILKKQRIFVEDVDKEIRIPAISTFGMKEGIKAYVGTPLVSNADALGVLYVSFKHPRRFSPDELSLIQIMANHASTAVHRAQLAERQITVTKIANDILRNLDVDHILQTILDQTLKLLNCREGSIALYDDATEELVLSYAIGKQQWTRISLQQGLMGATAVSKKPVRVGDVTKDKRYLKQVNETLSELDVPLLVGDDLIGVLNIESQRLNAFSPEDENLAMILASQAAIAIVNARLLKEANTRAEALKGLHNVASELVSIADIPENLMNILDQIAENARKVLGADLVDIYQYIQDKDSFHLPPAKAGDRLEPDIVKDRIFKDDVLYTIVGGRKALYVRDTQSRDSVLAIGFSSTERANLPRERFVIREKIESSASIPMIVAGEVVGVLFVNYRSQQDFSTQQQELIESFANQAAIAIRNNRLYGQLQSSNQELENLQNLGRKLTVETDLDKLLKEFLTSIYEVLGFEYATVSLVDRTQNFIETQHGIWQGDVDSFPEWIEMSRYILDDVDIQADIVRTGKVEIISGWDERFNKEIWEKFHHDRLIRIYMPIKIQEEVIGTIEAGYDKSQQDQISPVQQRTLQAFVDQAALAIQNARQFREIERNLEDRLADFHAIQEITEQMHQGDLDEVLELIAERAVELTGAKHGGVWLVDKTRTALKFGGLAAKEQYDQMPPDIPIGKDSENSISKWVVENKQSYLSGDVRKDENYKYWYVDTISELTVPIINQDRIIGTINVESDQEDSFTREHLRLLEAMAGQAAIVVQNARLLERLIVLDDISVKLTSGIRLHEDEILELIHQQASQLMDTDNMYIALYDDVTDMIRFPLMFVDGVRKEQPARKFEKESLGKTEWIIRNNEPILHATQEEVAAWYAQPGHQDFAESDVMKSWIGVPLHVGEKILGVVATYHSTLEYLYGQDELEVLSAMAGQAAIAIDNARLYYDVNQDLEESNKRLKSLVNFGEQVTSGIDLAEEEIIDLIYHQASQLMDTGNMYIALYDDVTEMISFPLMYVNEKRKEQPARKFGEKWIGKTEAIIQNKQPIFHTTRAEAEAWYAEPGHHEFMGDILASWIGVPMQVGGKILGVISTFHPTEDHWYTENDLTILEGIARIAAIAFENMRLYEEARGEAVAAKQLSTLGTAIAALQHRINNTFNIIIPNVDRLRKRVDLSDLTIVEILDIIERNARYTSKIISRIQEPLKEVEVTSININAIIDGVVLAKRELWKGRVTTPFVTIKFESDENIPVIWGPSGQIAEVIDNLLTNADKAMTKGGNIRIESKLKNGIIYIKVEDSGFGISQEIQNR